MDAQSAISWFTPMCLSLSIWITPLSKFFPPVTGNVWEIRLLLAAPRLLFTTFMPILVLLFLTALPVCAQNESMAITEWRAKVGDDVRWAQPDFDDSRWERSRGPERMDGSILDNRRIAGGAEWFRGIVQIPEWWSGQALALGVVPLNDAYEVYVNGSRIGGYGEFPSPGGSATDFEVVAYVERPASFLIPTEFTRGGEVHIAVRRWALHVPNAFGFLNAARVFEKARALVSTSIGLASAVSQQVEIDRDKAFHRALPNILMFTLTFCCGLLCFLLSPTRSKESEYFWLGLAMVCAGGYFFISFPASYLYSLPKTSHFALLWGFGINVAATFFYLLFLAELAPTMRRTLRAVAGPLAIVSGLWIVAAYFPSIWLSVPLVEIRSVASVFLIGAGSAAALIGLRAKKWDAMALSVGVFLRYLVILATTYDNRLNTATFGPIHFQFRILADAVIAVTLVCILYFRVRRAQSRQRQVETDLLAARRVQEMLLGTEAPNVPGFEIETAYRPAQEVGGDFYYFAPEARDGSLLAVVGDVSGKGLQAAMLVSSVIGSLRNEPSRAPGEVLAHLNHSLLGRTGGGFVTAVVARFDLGGALTVANAGHISPFCEGREVEVESGLPLGITAEASYPETVAPAGVDRCWTLVSDGVVEAANTSGELFGFERTREISTKTAQEIAEAAKEWGQNDDITVVTVRRNS